MALSRSSPASPATSASASPSPASPDVTLADRVATVYQRLTESASALNAVSDELAVPIAEIETALRKLNLGVTTWVVFASHVDEDIERFWERSIGYAKVSGKWGIAIGSRSGFFDDPETESWLFADAPRAYRLDSVDKLPELLEQLVMTAEETAEKLKVKVAVVNEVARAMVPESAFKDAMLTEIRKSKAVLYNMVIMQAQKIEIAGDTVTFFFSPAHTALSEKLEQNRTWIEDLVRRLTGRTVTVSTASLDAPAGK